MLLKMFVMGGPLLHCFWTLCSNFHVKRGVGAWYVVGARHVHYGNDNESYSKYTNTANYIDKWLCVCYAYSGWVGAWEWLMSLQLLSQCWGDCGQVCRRWTDVGDKSRRLPWRSHCSQPVLLQSQRQSGSYGLSNHSSEFLPVSGPCASAPPGVLSSVVCRPERGRVAQERKGVD